jgi:hypothetical protein
LLHVTDTDATTRATQSTQLTAEIMPIEALAWVLSCARSERARVSSCYLLPRWPRP